MRRFNEARAFCAGNQRELSWQNYSSLCFNEARAFCAGNRRVGARLVRELPASMRPALSAREIFKPDMTIFRRTALQ